MKRSLRSSDISLEGDENSPAQPAPKHAPARRCVWQAIAIAAALAAWHVFADDFATGVLAAGVTFVMLTAYADWRFGPLASAAELRRDVLNRLPPLGRE